LPKKKVDCRQSVVGLPRLRRRFVGGRVALEEHFADRGADFGASSEEEYAEQR
jgi:hypothetical protein